MAETDLLFLKPAPDRRARHEDGRLMSTEGEPVRPSSWWTRRLQDGDVVQADDLNRMPARAGKSTSSEK